MITEKEFLDALAIVNQYSKQFIEPKANMVNLINSDRLIYKTKTKAKLLSIHDYEHHQYSHLTIGKTYDVIPPPKAILRYINENKNVFERRRYEFDIRDDNGIRRTYKENSGFLNFKLF